MTWKKLFEDTYSLGFILGVALLCIFYYTLTGIRLLIIQYYGNPFVMAPPRVQLFTILMNIICFRYIILKFDRERTGKGLLFITLVAAFAYFYVFFHIKNGH